MKRKHKTKKAKPEPGGIVEVTWNDATSVGGWIDISELKQAINPLRCYSVGYFMTETDDAVVLAQSSGGPNVAEVLVIPKGMVISIRLLYYDE